MKKLLIVSGISLAITSMTIEAFEPEFNCSDIEGLVEMMELGVDFVAEEFIADPEYFLDYTIMDWKCLTEPFPPIRNDRNFLEAVQCFISDDILDVTESMLTESGRTYQKSLDRVYTCLEDDILSERADSYRRPTRGEGMHFVLDRYIENHFILLEFGFFQDSTEGTPIVWKISAIVGGEKQ